MLRSVQIFALNYLSRTLSVLIVIDGQLRLFVCPFERWFETIVWTWFVFGFERVWVLKVFVSKCCMPLMF